MVQPIQLFSTTDTYLFIFCAVDISEKMKFTNLNISCFIYHPPPLQHLTTLLASCDMQVVLSVLNLLYVFSKRSNYITRLGSEKRTPLLARLQHLAEVWWTFVIVILAVPQEVELNCLVSLFFSFLQSWGGKENGFGLAECCRDLPMTVRFFFFLLFFVSEWCFITIIYILMLARKFYVSK